MKQTVHTPFVSIKNHENVLHINVYVHYVQYIIIRIKNI